MNCLARSHQPHALDRDARWLSAGRLTTNPQNAVRLIVVEPVAGDGPDSPHVNADRPHGFSPVQYGSGKAPMRAPRATRRLRRGCRSRCPVVASAALRGCVRFSFETSCVLVADGRDRLRLASESLVVRLSGAGGGSWPGSVLLVPAREVMGNSRRCCAQPDVVSFELFASVPNATTDAGQRSSPRLSSPVKQSRAGLHRIGTSLPGIGSTAPRRPIPGDRHAHLLAALGMADLHSNSCAGAPGQQRASLLGAGPNHRSTLPGPVPALLRACPQRRPRRRSQGIGPAARLADARRLDPLTNRGRALTAPVGIEPAAPQRASGFDSSLLSGLRVSLAVHDGTSPGKPTPLTQSRGRVSPTSKAGFVSRPTMGRSLSPGNRQHWTCRFPSPFHPRRAAVLPVRPLFRSGAVRQSLVSAYSAGKLRTGGRKLVGYTAGHARPSANCSTPILVT